jgi:hypothetical protein
MWCEEHGGGGHHGGGCNYDQQAGALWDQRLKQYLLANGIAVVQLNPITADSWDNYEAVSGLTDPSRVSAQRQCMSCSVVWQS